MQSLYKGIFLNYQYWISSFHMKMIQNKQILTPEIHMEIEIQMMKIILVEESLRKCT